jgi:hypothetical protein
LSFRSCFGRFLAFRFGPRNPVDLPFAVAQAAE